MTLHFFQPSEQNLTVKNRYYISQFDGDTYQIVDSVENRGICTCSNYGNWKDAEKRAELIAKLLNEDSEN